MQENSITKMKINMILNIIKGVMTVLFPLITYPYVSRVLGVENLGKFNFSQSIIAYITLIAGVGFNSYAIRDGSAIRSDRERFSQFASEVFTLNMLSTLFSYFVLGLLLFFSMKLRDYTAIICVLSCNVFFQMFGIEWVYTIYEDFLYVTVRSIVFQIISLALLFIFVHGEDDLINYTVVTVFSYAGANVLNFVHAKKTYADIGICPHCNPKKHMPPSLIFFATGIFNTIYVSSDTTILGFLSGDREVGLYGVSANIYNILKVVLSSSIAVGLSRLCEYAAAARREEFDVTSSELLLSSLVLTLPATTGVAVFSKEIIWIIAGQKFADAAVSLEILAFSMPLYLLAYFWLQCILISYQKEKQVLIITGCSAVLNIVLNFILIPFFQQNAAAFTTALSEGMAAFVGFLLGRRHVKLRGVVKEFLKCVIGCLGIVAVSEGCKFFIANRIWMFLAGVVLSVIAYFCIEIVLRNRIIYSFTMQVMAKLRDMFMNRKKK